MIASAEYMLLTTKQNIGGVFKNNYFILVIYFLVCAILCNKNVAGTGNKSNEIQQVKGFENPGVFHRCIDFFRKRKNVDVFNRAPIGEEKDLVETNINPINKMTNEKPFYLRLLFSLFIGVLATGGIWNTDKFVKLIWVKGDVALLDSFSAFGAPLFIESMKYLRPLASACCAIMAFISGYILLYTSPKQLAVGGLFLQIVGWLFFSALGFDFAELRCVVTAIFVGMGTIALQMALVTVVSLLPLPKNFGISLVVTCSFLSYVIQMIISSIPHFPSSSFPVSIAYIILGLMLPIFLIWFDFPTNIEDNSDLYSNKLLEKNYQYNKKSPPTPKNKYPKLSVRSIVKKPKFYLMLLHSAFSFLMAKFFLSTYQYQLITLDGFNAYTTFHIADIASAAPCLLMAFFSMKSGITQSMAIIDLWGISMYVLAFMNSIVSKHVAVIANLIYSSFIVAPIYCYIQQNFSSRNFAMLSGLTIMLAELFALLIENLLFIFPWENVLENKGWPANNITLANPIMIAIGIINAIISTYLYRKTDEKYKQALIPQQLNNATEQSSLLTDMPETTDVTLKNNIKTNRFINDIYQ